MDACLNGACVHTPDDSKCTASDACHAASCDPEVGCVQTPVQGEPATVDLKGSSSVTGMTGNIRTFTLSNGVMVKASAFSRSSTGTWATAYLGSYGGGLGVTDGSEDGLNGTHRVDNVGRDNYVLFEFSEPVVVNQALLEAIDGADSDITVWSGTATDPFNNHLTLSDMVLSSLSKEENFADPGLTSRTANVNAGLQSSNVLVIAAWVDDTSPDDKFKIRKLGVNDCVPPPPPCPEEDSTVDLKGSSSVTGTKGNIRTFTLSNGVMVKASAFSRTSAGDWYTAYLGAYSGGLGVTDGSENGSGGTHKVDNIGRDNYVLFEFSEAVVVDQVLLEAIANDSDIAVWIGSPTADPYNNHLTLSDALLSSLFREENLTDEANASRTVSINASGLPGNVLVIAALDNDTSPEDEFKIRKLFTECE
jgi:hypothetical protein